MLRTLIVILSMAAYLPLAFASEGQEPPVDERMNPGEYAGRRDARRNFTRMFCEPQNRRLLPSLPTFSESAMEELRRKGVVGDSPVLESLRKADSAIRDMAASNYVLVTANLLTGALADLQSVVDHLDQQAISSPFIRESREGAAKELRDQLEAVWRKATREKISSTGAVWNEMQPSCRVLATLEEREQQAQLMFSVLLVSMPLALVVILIIVGKISQLDIARAATGAVILSFLAAGLQASGLRRVPTLAELLPFLPYYLATAFVGVAVIGLLQGRRRRRRE